MKGLKPVKIHFKEGTIINYRYKDFIILHIIGKNYINYKFKK